MNLRQDPLGYLDLGLILTAQLKVQGVENLPNGHPTHNQAQAIDRSIDLAAEVLPEVLAQFFLGQPLAKDATIDHQGQIFP